MKWKAPPRAKVYEALTAVADGRVRIVAPGAAEVTSSDRSKRYDVRWNEQQTAFASDDNGSKWQGYVGYPIIAVLLALGTISFSRDFADAIAGVEWKRLNDAAKRDYAAVIDYVLAAAESRGVDRVEIEAEVDRIYSAVVDLSLNRLLPAHSL